MIEYSCPQLLQDVAEHFKNAVRRRQGWLEELARRRRRLKGWSEVTKRPCFLVSRVERSSSPWLASTSTRASTARRRKRWEVGMV